ncbi:MAG: metallophosphoesterase [Gemmatimonadota bacterium]|nr:MAG: metallophosphoesterase [Gemmatimonadota bacterium]
MNGCIVHVSDTHFGGEADLALVEGVVELVPDLEPCVTVISGDLTVRARHGEFQAARALVQELEHTAPVFIIPGNHDVQWWLRPLIPYDRGAIYRKYAQYFGPNLTPTASLPGVLVAAANTAYGVTWGSLSFDPRDLAVKGHLPAKEIRRVGELFQQTDPAQLRVLVVHHNVIRGEVSERMGLVRWKRAQRQIVDCGAELVLCGHDHQECAEQLDRRVVVSCTGSLSTRSRSERPSVFHRICWDDESIQIEQYRWSSDRRSFKRADVHVFTRSRQRREAKIPARAS